MHAESLCLKRTRWPLASTTGMLFRLLLFNACSAFSSLASSGSVSTSLQDHSHLRRIIHEDDRATKTTFQNFEDLPCHELPQLCQSVINEIGVPRCHNAQKFAANFAVCCDAHTLYPLAGLQTESLLGSEICIQTP